MAAIISLSASMPASMQFRKWILMRQLVANIFEIDIPHLVEVAQRAGELAHKAAVAPPHLPV